jgi:hypothetical protein
VFVAALLIIVGQAWVAHSLALRPVWVFPLISTVLLVASIAIYERSETPGAVARALSRALIGVLVIANAASLVALVHGVFVGSALGPPGLLVAGLALWIVNLAVFALLYWELDGGGPRVAGRRLRGALPRSRLSAAAGRSAGHRPADLEAELLRLRLRLAHQRRSPSRRPTSCRIR